MFSQIKAWIAAAVAGVIGVLAALLKITQIQRDNARREAEIAKQQAETLEARIKQRQAAEEASAKAKAEGDKLVQEAVERARSGRRDHFERGLRDRN